MKNAETTWISKRPSKNYYWVTCAGEQRTTKQFSETYRDAKISEDGKFWHFTGDVEICCQAINAPSSWLNNINSKEFRHFENICLS